MAFRTALRVCFSDIDYAGIVYYPRFLHYFHVALEEFFGAEMGIDYSRVLIEHRIGFPTVHLETDFKRPLSYGDPVGVEVSVRDVGRSSITWGYRVHRSGRPEEVIAEGHNVTVTVDLESFEKVETPDWLREGLLAYRDRCGQR